LPTTATASIDIGAPAERVYDLVADVTNMGRWSPECHACTWLDEPGQVGSRFKGQNRRGPARWTTTAKVLVADPGREFTFATLHKDEVATRWSYHLAGDETCTTLAETFEAVRTPLLIAFAERYFIRNRQQQLEAGMASTLAAIKTAAEADPDPVVDRSHWRGSRQRRRVRRSRPVRR
jgi:uncharacterized protein YndB with AHSA1/START domain